MNIGFGKFGKAIKFDYKKWGLHGGDAAPSILLSALSQKFPNDTFYVVGRSDLSNMDADMFKEYFPNNNVINVWDDYKKISEDMIINKTGRCRDFTFVDKWFTLNNIELDVCLLFSGPATNMSMPGRFNKINKDGTISNDPYIILAMGANYCAPINYLLNVRKDLPFINICEDPRYFPLIAQDLFRRSNITLGQYNDKKSKFHFTDWEHNNTRSEETVIYAMTETVFALGDTPYNVDELYEKKTGKNSKLMNVYMNQGISSGGLDRGPIVKEWILDIFDNKDIKIHGKWEEPWSKMPNFTATPMQDLIEEMKHTKYTLIIPIKKSWVTSKFWKMLHFGILPFLHPEYDTQKNIPISDFLRLKSTKEFKEKIEQLENNPELYKKIFYETMNMLNEDIYEGRTLITNIYEHIYKFTNKNNKFIFPEHKIKVPVNSFVSNVKTKNKPLF